MMAAPLAVAATLAAGSCAPSSAASTATSAQGTQAGAPANRPVANVCDRKVVVPDDLVNVLSGAITTKTIAGDPQTCQFSTEDFSSVTVTVRPGLGDVTVTQWMNGGVPVNSVPTSGVGDRAVWQSTLKELIATKHNVLCDIQASGGNGTEADLQKKFGQLCDKVWAAQ
jgi:hypothetical protein